MNDDTICVVFCNLADAMEFLEDDDMMDCVVMSKVIPEGEAIVVPKDEFLEWLRDGRERAEKVDPCSVCQEFCCDGCEVKTKG